VKTVEYNFRYHFQIEVLWFYRGYISLMPINFAPRLSLGGYREPIQDRWWFQR